MPPTRANRLPSQLRIGSVRSWFGGSPGPFHDAVSQSIVALIPSLRILEVEQASNVAFDLLACALVEASRAHQRIPQGPGEDLVALVPVDVAVSLSLVAEL